jgi:hypothetical protein
MTIEPCPSPPDENGFCGDVESIYVRTGKYCEAKNQNLRHDRAVEICRLKKEMLKK